jgi:hypothetical protein
MQTWTSSCQRPHANPEKTAVRLPAKRFAGSCVRISRFETLRRRIMPFAEARGYLTDEEVFRDVS